MAKVGPRVQDSNDPLPSGSRGNKSSSPSASLAGQVAVVAGATRGAGRGIARALGEAGAIVYCTGRSVRGGPSPYGRPETIEETAELIERAGGTALAVRVDHSVEAEVQALFADVDARHHRLDVLVNSMAGEDPLIDPNFLESESPMFIGRAIAALAQDPAVMTRTGQLLSSWQLGREYELTDVDGRRPDWGAHPVDFSTLPPSTLEYFRAAARLDAQWVETVAARTRRFIESLPPEDLSSKG